MTKSHRPSTHALLIAGVAVLLGSLVALVESSGSRDNPPLVSTAPSEVRRERVPLELSEPEMPEPAEAAPAAVARSNERGAAPRAGFARIDGQVLHLDGSPAPSALVRLGVAETRTDNDGRFVLDLASPSEADLVAFEPGFAPCIRPAYGAGLVAGEDHTRLVLGEPTLAITGQVVDAEGKPLAGWSVELEGIDPLAALGLRSAARTDRAGRFTLTDVPAGLQILRALKDGHAPVLSTPVDAGASGVKLVVEGADTADG